jgi:ribosome-binding factor A
MRDVLSSLISREVHDPRVQQAGLVSVNHVELNRDMSVAHVYVAFLGASEEAGERATEALQHAAGFLRGPLGRELRLQRAPELRFVHDQSGEFGVRLSQVVREDQARRDESEGDES